MPIKNYLSVFLTFFLIIGCIVYVYLNFDRMLALIDLSISFLVLLFVLIALGVLARGLINYLLYKNFISKLTYNESIFLAIINRLANLLPLAAGLFAKGAYLKKQHNLSYINYFSVTAALMVCFIGINGFLGLIGLAYLTKIVQVDEKLGLGFFYLCMTASIAILWIPCGTRWLPEKYQKKIHEINVGWNYLSHNPILLFKITLLQVIMILLIAARFYIFFKMFSQNILFVHCILFSTATILTRILNIVPGGIGIREGIVGGIGSLFGLNFGVCALLVAIERFVTILFLFLLGIVYTQILSKSLNKWRIHDS